VLQGELDRLRRSTGATIIFVTHDIGEAITLADRVVTMTAGPAATIKTVATVDLQHPRDLTDPAALQLQRLLRDDIAAEVTRALAAQGLEQAA
jgi:NitT/TauT family transport system ATP-binding protein